MVRIIDSELEKLGIYEIECEISKDDWIHVKMKVSLKFWLRYIFQRIIDFLKSKRGGA